MDTGNQQTADASARVVPVEPPPPPPQVKLSSDMLTPVPLPVATDAALNQPSLVDSLIKQSDVSVKTTQSQTDPPSDNSSKKHKSGVGFMLAGILILMIALPVGIYFVSQQNTRVTEQRSCATGDGACITPGPYSATKVPSGFTCNQESCCHAYANKTCHWTGTVCSCTTYGECTGDWGACHSDSCVCIEERSCEGTNDYQIRGCSGCTPCNETPTNPPNGPTDPPVSTPTTAPGQCSDIKVYKNGARVDLATVKHGDVIELAVTGLKATKARIRVNSGGWTTTEVKNSNGEYRISFTVPNDINTFTIEAEIYDSVTGLWK